MRQQIGTTEQKGSEFYVIFIEQGTKPITTDLTVLLTSFRLVHSPL